MSNMERLYTGVYDVPVFDGRIHLPRDLALSALNRTPRTERAAFCMVPDGIGGRHCSFYDKPTFNKKKLVMTYNQHFPLINDKIQLTQDLMKYLDVRERVVLVGVLDGVEMWNPKSFKEELKFLNSFNWDLALTLVPRLNII